MHVAQVDFDGRQANGLNGVPNGNAIGREAGRIDNQSIGPLPGILKGIDDVAFMVELLDPYLDLQVLSQLFNFMVDLGQRVAAVNLGVPHSHQVQIRSVNDPHRYHRSRLLSCGPRLKLPGVPIRVIG